jgi:hypothetical protein
MKRQNLSVVIKLVNIVLMFSLFGCSGGLIKRNTQGVKVSASESPNRISPVKKKIALLSLFNEAPYGGDDLAITATEELRGELAKIGEFIIDPSGAKIFGPSKEIYAGGGVKLAQLSRQAKVSGINLVVFGRVMDARIREKTDEIGLVRQTKSFTESKVEIRVFDVNSNREILNDVLRGFADDSNYRLFTEAQEERLNYRRDLLRYAVKVAVRQAIPKVVQTASKLDWIGRVAKIIGNKIYINAGRSSGIQISDILKVITEGQDIFDPETGGMIGTSKGEVKGTVEIIDYFGPDGSVAILHSGGTVQEGDFVQLY